MAFLELDGYAPPISLASPTRRVPKMGRRGRSFRGQIRDSRRGSRRMWDCTACFVRIGDSHHDAEAFMRQVNGEGHVCYFAEGVNMSTGLQPLPGYSGFRLDRFLAGAFSEAGTLVTTDTGELLRYDAQLQDGNWTFGSWDNDSGFRLKARTGDGRAYNNGVLSPTTLTPVDEFSVDVDDGVAIYSTNVAAGQITDDIFILPYNASEAQIVGWSSMQRAMGPLPVMRMTGDIVREGWIYVVGTVIGRDYINKPTNIDGFGWVNNAQLVRFNLAEVPAGWRFDDQVPGLLADEYPQGST